MSSAVPDVGVVVGRALRDRLCGNSADTQRRRLRCRCCATDVASCNSTFRGVCSSGRGTALPCEVGGSRPVSPAQLIPGSHRLRGDDLRHPRCVRGRMFVIRMIVRCGGCCVNRASRARRYRAGCRSSPRLKSRRCSLLGCSAAAQACPGGNGWRWPPPRPAFASAVAALWATNPPDGIPVVQATVCVLVLALATMVEFDTPFGFTVPTQLAFVPLRVRGAARRSCRSPSRGAFADRRAPERPRRARSPPSRLLIRASPTAWFAIGPVAVFAIAQRSEPQQRRPALLLIAALGAPVRGGLRSFRRSASRSRAERTCAPQLTRDAGSTPIDAALSRRRRCVVAEEPPPHVAGRGAALLPLLGLARGVCARAPAAACEGMLELSNAYRGTALVLGDVVECRRSATPASTAKSVVGLALDARRRDLGLER